MQIIQPSTIIIHQENTLEGIYKQIELAGRTCYKSEDKITEDSAKEFVIRMIKSKHGAMLEHGTAYLKLDFNREDLYTEKEFYILTTNKYSKAFRQGGIYYISTNYRVIIENRLRDCLKNCICSPEEFHEKRITVKFVCDRGISHEFVRHRADSFAQESTRFCDYIKDKFNGSVSFILPSYIKSEDTLEAEEDLKLLEALYFKWRNKGYKAEEARFILPTALKTELVMTGFVSDWEHFFKLRCASSAHPQARELVIPLEKEFKRLGYIK